MAALSLEARLNALNFTYQFAEVREILETTQARVTFWGARLVETAGNESATSLSESAKKVAQEVWKILSTGKGLVTFWKTFLIGNKDAVKLDDITRKVVQAIHQRRAANNLTQEERVLGFVIVENLRNFYHRTDVQISQSKNIVTRFLVWIREFSIIPFPTRFQILDKVGDDVLGLDFEPGARLFQERASAK